MTDDYCIDNRVYDKDLYNSYIKEYWQKEKPEKIKDYMSNFLPITFKDKDEMEKFLKKYNIQKFT